MPNAPITYGRIVTFMFHRFFNSLARSRYLSFFSLSFKFILWSAWTAKSTILQILFLLLIIMRSGLLAGIRWSVLFLLSLLLFCFLLIFYSRFSWWCLTSVWRTANFLRFSGLFSVFWPISTFLLSEWSQFILQFPTVPNPFPAFGDRSKPANFKWY